MLKQEKMLSLISNRILELILLPTEQCNFRCTYCYEDFSIGKMKEQTVTAIKKLVSARIDTLDTLKISWFGGEPLAAKDVIHDISRHIQQAMQAYPGLQYCASMTTNGLLLTPRVLEKMVMHGVTHFQVSLDGTEELHNKTRIRLNRLGSFRQIWNNLLAARATELNFSIMLRVHVTPENLGNIPKLCEEIKTTFGEDNRFSIFFKAIENLGGSQAGSFNVLQNSRKVIQLLSESMGSTMQLHQIQDNGPYVCYAAKTNSFVIRADGRVGKCTVALSDERNVIGHLQEDGTLLLDQAKILPWVRGLGSQNLNELKCPASGLPAETPTFQSIPVVVSLS